MDSVHSSTVTSLETTMSEIVTMLRHSHSLTTDNESKWTATPAIHVPRKPKPVTSTQSTTLPSTEGTSDRVSYSDSARRAPSLDTPMAHRGGGATGSIGERIGRKTLNLYSS
jgi:hypothetical protein